jgi:hypothetical protein
METKLTPAQKATIELRMKAMEKDFGLQAYRLVFNETDIAEKGDWAPRKKEKVKQKRRSTPREEWGKLTDVAMPWLKLAVENPKEVITLRPSDLNGIGIKRMQSGITAAACYHYGKGVLNTQLVKDDLEGTALRIFVVETALPSNTAVKIRGGNVSSKGNGQAAPGIAA